MQAAEASCMLPANISRMAIYAQGTVPILTQTLRWHWQPAIASFQCCLPVPAVKPSSHGTYGVRVDLTGPSATMEPVMTICQASTASEFTHLPPLQHW